MEEEGEGPEGSVVGWEEGWLAKVQVELQVW